MSTISAGNTTTTSIKITGDTTGNLVLATNGGTTALTIDTSQNITTAQRFAKASMPTGSILQVVSNTTSTQVTVSSIAFTDSGLSASITPTSATSKILVMITQAVDVFSTARFDNGMGIRLLRDSTTIWNPSVSGAANGAGYGGTYISVGTTASIFEIDAQIPMTYLDSPATANVITYKTQGGLYSAANSTTLTFQPSGAATNGKSSIVLMEIAA